MNDFTFKQFLSLQISVINGQSDNVTLRFCIKIGYVSKKNINVGVTLI